jgi:hypothetical protein
MPGIKQFVRVQRRPEGLAAGAAALAAGELLRVAGSARARSHEHELKLVGARGTCFAGNLVGDPGFF